MSTVRDVLIYVDSLNECCYFTNSSSFYFFISIYFFIFMNSKNYFEDLEDFKDNLDDFDSIEIRKKDGRLFLEYPLYCEGFHKPTCRGVLHLVN